MPSAPRRTLALWLVRAGSRRLGIRGGSTNAVHHDGHNYTGDMDQLTDELRSRGYRLTPQRQLILEAVTHLGHATPEDVHGWVVERASGVNISTVYRTLELLEELGLVKHAHLSHGAPTYHAAAAPEHVHLICRDCGSISEISPAVVGPLVKRLKADHGFVADVGHLTIFGSCKECAS